MAERLDNLVDRGSFNLSWWVNQGQSLDFERAETCICAPRKTTRGMRSASGLMSVECSPATGSFTTRKDMSLPSAKHSPTAPRTSALRARRRHGRMASRGVHRDAPTTRYGMKYHSRRSKDAPPVSDPSPRRGSNKATLSATTSSRHSLSVTPNDSRTVLNPGNIWLFQANPTAQHTQFPQRLQSRRQPTPRLG